ncbi:preprotein translocase subunit YajC [Enterococcus hirae]|nr:preprotein translocase subunit YajC [Enterococcus hirae]
MASSLPMIILLVVMVGMWIFMGRNQKKQQQKRQELLNAIKPGDEVVTIGGLHGIVSEVNDSKNTVLLDCEGIFLEYDRASIKGITPASETAQKVQQHTPNAAVTPEEPAHSETPEESKDETK